MEIDFDAIHKDLNTDENMYRILEYYNIQRSGNRFCCPFHNDKHPSAGVYHGRLHCFTCGKSFSIFDVIKQMGADKPLKTAMDICGMDISGYSANLPFEESENRQRVKKDREAIYRLCKMIGVKSSPVYDLGPYGTEKVWHMTAEGDMEAEYLSKTVAIRDPVFEMFDSRQDMLSFLNYKYQEKRRQMVRNLEMVRFLYVGLSAYQQETRREGIKEIPFYREVGKCMRKHIDDLDNLAKQVFEEPQQ